LGFGSFIGGIMLSILAVLLAFLGIVVLLVFVNFIPTSFDTPFRGDLLIVALLMLAYGWYSYQSAKATRNNKRPHPMKISS